MQFRKTIRPSRSFETTHPDRATPSCSAPDRNARVSFPQKGLPNRDGGVCSCSFGIPADDMPCTRRRRRSRALGRRPPLAALPNPHLNRSSDRSPVARASHPKGTGLRQRLKMTPREPTLETSVPLALTSFSPACYRCLATRDSRLATCTNLHPTCPKLLSCPTFRWTNAPLHC